MLTVQTYAQPAPETVRAAVAGNPAATAEVASWARQVGYRTARARGASTWDADDAGQAAAVAVLERFGRLRDPAAVGGWVGRVAENAYREALRGRLATLNGEDPSHLSPVSIVPQGVPEAVPGPAVRGLPRRERAAVVLHYFRGLTIREVGEELGCSFGAAKQLLRRARRRLAGAVVAGAKLAAVTA